MRLVATLAVALWVQHQGDTWLADHHPPANAYRVAASGVGD
jgi:hypothetical protein